MKLASLKGGRDGRLVVVSQDLAWCADASAIAPTLQAALDDWETAEPLLRGLAESLEHGSIPRERFHEHEADSPLPRAYQWADGSAYVNHVALVRKARAADMPGRWYSAETRWANWTRRGWEIRSRSSGWPTRRTSPPTTATPRRRSSPTTPAPTRGARSTTCSASRPATCRPARRC